jgi:hypothetical protein
MDEPKPCPSCGKQPVKDETDKGIYVHCGNKGCPLRMIEFVFDAWQSRPIEDAQAEQIKRQVGRISELESDLANLRDTRNAEPGASLANSLNACNVEWAFSLKNRVAELEQLIEMQHRRTVEADKRYQAANKVDYLPDLGDLVRWLMEQADKAEARTVELDRIVAVANDTASCYLELPDATTQQAWRDSMWRLTQALRGAGYQYKHNNLDWRGSIFKELNDAGFYPNSANAYDAGARFVYDPNADKDNPARVFGNATGPTIAEIVKEWLAGKWTPIWDGKPKKEDAYKDFLVIGHGMKGGHWGEYSIQKVEWDGLDFSERAWIGAESVEIFYWMALPKLPEDINA